MIIKGGARGKAGNLAAHVLRTDQNERVRIVELIGVVADTVPGALAEMAAHACGTRATKPLYHASLSPDPKAPPLTREQWKTAIDRLEQHLSLVGCARAVLEHEKAGADGTRRTHRHVVWSRTDLLTGRIVPCKMNWATHERVGRELEIEFHHATVGGGLIRPGGHERPGRGAKDWEEQQRGRTGIDPAEVKRQATAIWRSADSGRSFQAGLAAAGLILARGDKPGAVVLIDTQGGVHGLGRRIEGVRAAEIKTRLADLDPSTLPSVQEVRAGLKEKDGDQAAKGPDRTTPKQWTPSRKAHPGHLPRPSGLRARRSFGGRNNAFLFGAERDRIGRLGGRASVEPPTSRSQTATLIDVTLPDDRPGIDPLEVLNAIQQLKKAIGAGANLGEGLKRMEALYGRLMLNG